MFDEASDSTFFSITIYVYQVSNIFRISNPGNAIDKIKIT